MDAREDRHDPVAKSLDYLVLVLAVVFGVGSVALFAWETRPVFVALHWSQPLALAWDALLSFVFFVQHSGMVRRSFRARLAAFVPARYDRAVYAISSGVALALVVVFWQRTDSHLLVMHGAPRWIMVGLGLAAVAVFVYSAYVLRPFDPLGLSAIWASLRHRPTRPSSFVVRGPYRWVRHPLYSCILVLFWATPDLTADRLLLDILWTGWIIVGAKLEERDLVAEFGDAYRWYQRRVPMLVPWRGRVQFETEPAVG